MDAIGETNVWRYPGGYQWLGARSALSPTAVAETDMILTTGLPETTYWVGRYKPPPNLFLEFAETPDTEEGVKQFADHYGLLGFTSEREGAVLVTFPDVSRTSESAAAKGPGVMQSVALGTGELLSAWRKEIEQMRQATMLWSDLREAESGNTTQLSRHIQWRKSLVYYDTHPELPLPPSALLLGIPPSLAPSGRLADDDIKDDLRTIAVIASRRHNSERLRLFRIGDCLMPGRYHLQHVVNQHLTGAASPQLQWNVKQRRPYALALLFVPTNLLGLMWLQLAEAINGNRQYRRCPGCKTWIVISPATIGSRSSRITCSNACRMKVYYGRKLEARRLRQEGLAVTEIATRLKAEPATVRGWIASGGAERAVRKKTARKISNAPERRKRRTGRQPHR